MRLTLELRIMADSDLILAPQRGNRWGTASIEILSVPDAVTDEEWAPFCQEVVDLWAGLRGVMVVGGQEEPLNVRPHWAKEWEDVRIRGVPAREYLRGTAYREEVGEFRAVLGEIGREQGWGLRELKDRFSNELWDYLVFERERESEPEREAVNAGDEKVQAKVPPTAPLTAPIPHPNNQGKIIETNGITDNANANAKKETPS